MYLNDEEVLSIESFCKNETMFEAVKKVILNTIYDQGVIKPGEKHNPLKNRALALVGNDRNNEDLGSQVRAWWEGINALENAYSELKKIKSDKAEKPESAVNEGV